MNRNIDTKQLQKFKREVTKSFGKNYSICNTEKFVTEICHYVYENESKLRSCMNFSCNDATVELEINPKICELHCGLHVNTIYSHDVQLDNGKKSLALIALLRDELPLITYDETKKHYELYIASENDEVVKQLIKNALLHNHNTERDYINIYSVFAYEQYSFCRKVGIRKKRNLETIYLSSDIKKEIFDDVNNFFANESAYNERGISFKRNYLLEGVPGTGKTSLVCALASYLNYDVAIISLESPHIKLEQVIHEIPPRTILLIEDIQHTFPQNTSNNNEMQNVKIDNVLNILDGIYYKYGLLTFMTLNPSMGTEFPPNLLRPGRVDKRFIIDRPTTKEIKEIFTNFCPSEDADEFYKSIQPIEKLLTPAMLQTHLFGTNGKKRNINELFLLANSNEYGDTKLEPPKSKKRLFGLI